MDSPTFAYSVRSAPQVNGTDVSSLCRVEVLHLLAGPEKTLSLVLHREPSVTML